MGKGRGKRPHQHLTNCQQTHEPYGVKRGKTRAEHIFARVDCVRNAVHCPLHCRLPRKTYLRREPDRGLTPPDMTLIEFDKTAKMPHRVDVPQWIASSSLQPTDEMAGGEARHARRSLGQSAGERCVSPVPGVRSPSPARFRRPRVAAGRRCADEKSYL